MRSILRNYTRNLPFALMFVVTLALGMGSTVTVFTLVSGLFLRPLPFPESERLASITETDTRNHAIPVSGQDFQDWKTQSKSFTEMAAYTAPRAKLTLGHDTMIERCAEVTPGFFETLGISPETGRTFSVADDRAGNDYLVIISDSLFRALGGHSEVLGTTLQIDNHPYTIIGVMPSGFDFPARAQFWVPKILANDHSQRGGRYLQVIARLKPNVELRAAAAEMQLVSKQLADEYPGSNAKIGARVVSLRDELFGNLQTTASLLFAAALLLFLVGSFNAIHLHMAKTVARQQEFATRIALGANLSDLLKQVALEISPLVLLSAALGLGITHWGLWLIRQFLSDRLPPELHLGIDAWALAFASVLFIVIAVGSAAFSARKAFQKDFLGALKAEGRVASGKHAGRLSGSFISTQVAFSLTLLIMAFAIIVGLLRLEEVRPGFQPNNVLVFRLALDSEAYPDNAVQPFYQRLITELHSLPGVTDVGGVDFIPLGSAGIRGYARKRDEINAPMPNLTIVGYRTATPDYFRTLGIRLLEGRYFTAADDMRSQKVAVVNQEAAKRLWPHQSALGQEIQLHNPTADWLTVVGVIANNKEGKLDEADQPLIFEASTQQLVRTMYVTIRSTIPISSLLPAVRSQVKLLDPDLPLSDVSTMQQVVADTLINPRLESGVVGIFSICALSLTLIGLYAFISYVTLQRTQEIGIRVALGAQRSHIFWIVTKDALKLASIGIAAGVAAAFTFTKLLASRIWGMPMPETNAVTAACIALLLLVLIASFIPAFRAARQAPLHALRGGK
jgi:putative ABC transport system permease protein